MKNGDFSVLCVDPGGITRKSKDAHAGTGYAEVGVIDGQLVIGFARQVLWDEWSLANNLESQFALGDHDMLVYEDFIPRYGVPFSLDPVKLIGAMRATIADYALHPVSPSAHKSVVPREWAKSLVIEAGHQVLDGHCVDAVRLGLYYGIQNRNPVVLEALKQWRNK